MIGTMVGLLATSKRGICDDGKAGGRERIGLSAGCLIPKDPSGTSGVGGGFMLCRR